MRNDDISTDDVFKLLSGELTTEDIRHRREEKIKRKQQNKILGDIQNQYEEKFKKLSTRRLLMIFKYIRSKISEQYEYYGEVRNNEYEIQQRWALRKILSTREHVLNVQEGKNKRAAFAKKNAGKNKSKNR